MNADLEVNKLVICVPKYCRLERPEHVGPADWERSEREAEASSDSRRRDDAKDKMWDQYLDSLERKVGGTCETKECEPCSFEQGWELRGNCAIEHARRVHDRLQRQVLRFHGVSGVDVGFAVVEGERRFENVLAIRIHVSKKLSGFQLDELGHPSLTSLLYLPLLRVQSDPEKIVQREKLIRAWAAALGKDYTALEEFIKDSLEGGKYAHYPISGVEDEDLSWHCDENGSSCGCDKSEVPYEGCDFSRCRLCICGVPLDIVEAEYFPSALGRGRDTDSGVFVDPLQTSTELSEKEAEITSRCRVNPLVGGISIGTVTGQAGTLGAVVWDRTDGSPCLLSNWHVLAGNPAARVGQPSYQPALFDGGREGDIVAHLKRWHLGEVGDAAIAELSGDRDYGAGEILGLWNPIAGYETPRLNMEIRKWGRTTGFTQGFIDGLYLATNIDYGQGVIRYFKNQFHIAPLFSGEDVSQVGDSGSVVVTSYKPKELMYRQRFLLDLLRRAAQSQEGNLRTAILTILEDEKLTWSEQISDLLELLWGKTHGNGEAHCPQGECQQHEMVEACLEKLGVEVEELKKARKNRESKEEQRVYFAVGLIFAGDTPGSPFGEFALASDLRNLADTLQFSLRPVFEPRTSFRKLRHRSRGGGRTGARDPRILEPGRQGADPRDQAPQPDAEPFQTGP